MGSTTARKTVKPWMRIDIKLSATLPYGEPIAMPAPKAWAAWAREVLGRLENIEPLPHRVRASQQTSNQPSSGEAPGTFVPMWLGRG